MSKNLIFVEFQSQIEPALKERENNPDSCEVIALSPEAMYYLYRRGISYSIPEDYYKEEELNEIGLANFQKLEELCKIIDNIVIDACPSFKQYELKPMMFHFYHLKILIDSLSLRLAAILRVLEHSQPSRVYYFSPDPQPVTWELCFFPKESIFSHLIPLVSDYLGIQCNCLDVSSPTNHSPTPKKSSFWQRHLKQMHKEKVNILFKTGILRHLSNVSNKPTILVILQSADIDSLFKACVSNKLFRFIFWNGEMDPFTAFPLKLYEKRLDTSLDSSSIAAIDNELTLFWKRICESSEIKETFNLSGISYWDVIQPRLQCFFTQCLREIFLLYTKALILLPRFRVNMVLTGTTFGYRHKAIVAAANKLQIPVCTSQHGGGYGVCDMPMHTYTDFIGADYFWAYGEGVCKHFADRHKSNTGYAVPVPIGSSSLDALKEKLSNDNSSALRKKYGLSTDKLVVMYTITNLSGNRRYIYQYSDNAYYRLQKQIVDLLSEFDVQCVLKAPPFEHTLNPIKDYIRDNYADQWTILSREPFTKVVSMADVHLFDWPITVFLQALLTQKPIIALFDYRYAPISDTALESLPGRVICATDPQTWMTKIRQYLMGQLSDWDSLDKHFLLDYGTQGQSIQRAIRCMNELTLNTT